MDGLVLLVTLFLAYMAVKIAVAIHNLTERVDAIEAALEELNASDREFRVAKLRMALKTEKPSLLDYT